jgi:hypothetical protein
MGATCSTHNGDKMYYSVVSPEMMAPLVGCLRKSADLIKLQLEGGEWTELAQYGFQWLLGKNRKLFRFKEVGNPFIY